LRANGTLAAILALILVVQPLLVAMPLASADADGPTRSGNILTITEEYVVNDRQEWNHVEVEATGTLRIVEGGMLITPKLILLNSSRLHILGGTLAIWTTDMDGDTSSGGNPREVLMTQGGLLLVEGRAGDPMHSMGQEGAFTLSVTDRVLIEDSQVFIKGGDGYSPETPGTEEDLEGGGYSGGASQLYIAVEKTGTGLSIIRSTIRVEGGHGGDAPDGSAPVGELGGMAGGYVAGGNVSGPVGSGGGASLYIDVPKVQIVSSLIEVEAGEGGDAGDGGRAGTKAGGGGGGYSGGDGAGTQGAAGIGGPITGEVGAGGRARIWVGTYELTMKASKMLINGGDGGDAGDGGDCDPSRPDTILSGGGGGGYSGGGGGAPGELAGTDGGHGGAVSGRVGAGGSASIEIWANGSVIHSSELLATGGAGGRGGTAGTSTRGVGDWDWRAGGGGGSYSAGGGGGTSSTTWSRGAGGTGRPVEGRVGAGGDATLELRLINATIPTNASLHAVPGGGGECWRSDAPGLAGGEGKGAVTTNGYRREHIPMARVELLSPGDGAVSSTIPIFTWGQAHDATAAGRVMRYEFQLDDDPAFGSPEMGLSINTNQLEPGWLPNFTNHWRVRALYERPWQAAGPWSTSRAITYINLPPEIAEIPLFDIMVSEVTSVDLSPYITDPDNVVGHLSLWSGHPNVVDVSHLNITLYFTEELGTIPVNFTVSDGLNVAEGQFMVSVTRYRHPPFILGVTNHRLPIELKLFEATEAWYDIQVHDVDSTKFTYWVTGSWEDATAFPNGTLRVRGAKGDVGGHEFRLHVADEGGREASIKVAVDVLNVNDPPDPPSILSPKKRITVREGEMVTFSALVSDPDLRHGQVLNVTFVSNETGVMRTMQTTTTASVSSSSLPVGEHVVTVVVFDGQYSASDQVVVTVEAPPEPPPVKTSSRDGPALWVYVVTSVVLFAVGFTAGHLHLRRRSKGGPEGPS